MHRAVHVTCTPLPVQGNMCTTACAMHRVVHVTCTPVPVQGNTCTTARAMHRVIHVICTLLPLHCTMYVAACARYRVIHETCASLPLHVTLPGQGTCGCPYAIMIGCTRGRGCLLAQWALAAADWGRRVAGLGVPRLFDLLAMCLFHGPCVCVMCVCVPCVCLDKARECNHTSISCMCLPGQGK